jgi:acetyltransferase-like isoleucine patch superfamily enzyme
MLSMKKLRELAKLPHLRPLVRFIRGPLRASKARLIFGRWDVNVHGPYTVVRPGKVKVGANLSINHGVFILGGNGIVIGDNVRLAARSMLVDSGPVGQGNIAFRKNSEESKITIGNNVLIGAGAIILPGINIGDDAIVGAGALVVCDVEPGITVIGNPARRVWRSNLGNNGSTINDNTSSDPNNPFENTRQPVPK